MLTSGARNSDIDASARPDDQSSLDAKAPLTLGALDLQNPLVAVRDVDNRDWTSDKLRAPVPASR